MKKLFTILVCSIALLSTSCGNSQKQNTEQQEVDKSGPEYTSAYVCPMHCEGSGSDKPGACPVCGMDYVENKNASGHESHDGDHGEEHMNDHSDHMDNGDDADADNLDSAED